MKAFLLAGGYGTRLRPITNHTPKCLVDIGGKPLLQHWLEQLVDNGFTDILINTHYLHEQVEAFIDGSDFKPYVTLAYEKELLGTLGSIRANRDFLTQGTVLIAHADNFVRTDWQAFLKCHNARPEQCDMTMMLFETDNPSTCGMVEVNDQGVMTSYIEKPEVYTKGNLANAAIFLFEPSAISRAIELSAESIELCKCFIPTQVEKICTYKNIDFLKDIGTIESYKQILSYCNYIEKPKQL